LVKRKFAKQVSLVYSQGMTIEQKSFPASSEQLEQPRKGVRAIFREAIEAMRRSDDINRVRLARVGLWQGEPTMVIPSTRAQGPLDGQGMVNAARLTDGELRLAVDMRLLSRGVLLSADQERLDRTPAIDDPSLVTELYKKVHEDMARFTPETPNYS